MTVLGRTHFGQKSIARASFLSDERFSETIQMFGVVQAQVVVRADPHSSGDGLSCSWRSGPRVSWAEKLGQRPGPIVISPEKSLLTSLEARSDRRKLPVARLSTYGVKRSAKASSIGGQVNIEWILVAVGGLAAEVRIVWDAVIIDVPNRTRCAAG